MADGIATTGQLVEKKSQGFNEMVRRVWENYLPPAVFLAVVIVTWELAVRLLQVPAWLLPAPSDIYARFLTADTLWMHTRLTLIEAAVGFGISAVLGIISAAGIAHSKFLERGVYPYVIVSNSIPIVAIAPLLTIWFGYGLTPKIMIVALITFFPIVANTTRGLLSADHRIIEMMQSLNASRWQIFSRIQLPSALPYVLSAFKIAASLSLVGAVVGEFYGADHGLGYLVIFSASQLETDLLFVAIAVLAVTGVASFALFNWLEQRFTNWKA